MSVLLDAGAAPSARNSKGVSAAAAAAKGGHTDTLTLLSRCVAADEGTGCV